jgi:hypothetical protein
MQMSTNAVDVIKINEEIHQEYLKNMHEQAFFYKDEVRLEGYYQIDELEQIIVAMKACEERYGKSASKNTDNGPC